MEEKCRKKGISHLLTAEPMPEVHIDDEGVEEDVLLGQTEIQELKAEQLSSTGVHDYHKVWLLTCENKPNLAMTDRLCAIHHAWWMAACLYIIKKSRCCSALTN